MLRFVFMGSLSDMWSGLRWLGWTVAAAVLLLGVVFLVHWVGDTLQPHG